MDRKRRLLNENGKEMLDVILTNRSRGVGYLTWLQVGNGKVIIKLVIC